MINEEDIPPNQKETTGLQNTMKHSICKYKLTHKVDVTIPFMMETLHTAGPICMSRCLARCVTCIVSAIYAILMSKFCISVFIEKGTMKFTVTP